MKQSRLSLLLSILTLLNWSPSCLACWEQISVDGYRPSFNSRGTFVSENFPHALPARRRCTYEFRIYYSGYDEINALCFHFQEMNLFTVKESFDLESILEVRWHRDAEPILTYGGNGSLLVEADDPDGFIVSRPENLLNGSLCLTIQMYSSRWQYIVTVTNYKFVHKVSNRLTRFLAIYKTTNTNDPDWQTNSSLSNSSETQHRCLDGTYVDEGNRCNTINDCFIKDSNSSDFLEDLASDESYEHARCNSSRSFGTSFALGQASAHNLLAAAQLDCTMDHSRLFNDLSHARDCSMKMQFEPEKSFAPAIRLSGVLAAANSHSAACYRFFWFSRGFNNDNEALTLAEPDGGRVLIRLPARWRLYTWNMAEVQLEPGFSGRGLDVFVVLSKQQNRTIGAHWLDDLSAEPAACNASAYERRMPSTCSFEWSTCNWETTNLPVVTDKSVAKKFRANISDHTSSLVPDRSVPPLPQRMLHLTPEFNGTVRIESRRGLPFGSFWCFEIWLYGLGDGNYSVTVDLVVDLFTGLDSRTFFTLTVPNNQWRLLSGDIRASSSIYPSMRISLKAKSRQGLRAVLLDDLSVLEDSCFRKFEVNGTAECGKLEWLCFNKKQCILPKQICDGRFDCDDKSDEVNCFVGSGPDWAVILPAGAAPILLLLVALVACWCSRGRSASSRPDPDDSANSAVQHAAAFEAPPSYEEATEGPPKYEELQHN